MGTSAEWFWRFFSPKILQNNCQCDLRGLDHFLGLPKFPKIGFTGLQHQYSPIFGIYVHLDQWNWHFCGVLPSTKVRTTFRVTLESQEQFLGLPKKFDCSVWMIDVISYVKHTPELLPIWFWWTWSHFRVTQAFLRSVLQGYSIHTEEIIVFMFTWIDLFDIFVVYNQVLW